MTGKFSKAYTVFTVGLIAWVTDVVNSKGSEISSREWKEALIVVIATIGVWAVPNAARSDAG